MLAERVRGIVVASSQMIAELRLLAKRRTVAHLAGLLFLRSADVHCRVGYLVDVFDGPEVHTVIVVKDIVISGNEMFTNSGTYERVVVPAVRPARSESQVTVTENRESNLPRFRRIAIEPPLDNAGQSRGLGLQHHKAANARLIGPSTVVDDEDVVTFTFCERRQENVDAAVMSRGRRVRRPYFRQ